MAFAGVSLVVDGKLCDSTLSPVDAGADSGYHLLVVEGYSHARETTLNNCDHIMSRRFIVGGYLWVLEFYPNAFYDDDEDREFISVCIVMCQDVEQSVEAQVFFSFIDQPEMQVPFRNRPIYKFGTSEGFRYGKTRFAKREVLKRSRHMKNDSFTIRCDITVIKNTEEQGAGTVESHFGNLLSKDGSDITFEVRGKEFAAHRCVLAAQSAVFKAQLFGGTGEGSTVPIIVKIDDIEADVFESMLTFIYTGVMPDYKMVSMKEDVTVNMEEEDDAVNVEAETTWLLEFLEAAERYELHKLKSICEETLAGRYICASTVSDILGVAERARCTLLKKECMDFIKSHTRLPSLFAPDGLEEMISTCSPVVLKGLLKKYA